MVRRSDESGNGSRRSPTDRDVRRIAMIAYSIVDDHLARMATLEGRNEGEAETEWLHQIVALAEALVVIYVRGAVGLDENPDKRVVTEIRAEMAATLMEAVEARRGVLLAGLGADPMIDGAGPAGEGVRRG
jgi:hypothetical protein